MAKKRSGALATFVVDFRGVSANKETVSISVKLDRSRVQVETMEEFFCGCRLSSELRLGDGTTQSLPGMDDAEQPIEASFDAMSYGAHRNNFTTRLRTTKGIDLGVLSEYSGKAGRLFIRSVDAIVEDDEESDGDAGDDEADSESVASLGLSATIVERLENAGYGSVADLRDLIERETGWWNDVKGIGEVAAEKIAEALGL